MAEYEPHRPNYAELKNENAKAQQRQQQQEATPEPTHEPHRPNYAELKNEHAEAQREQQQEATTEPTRPDRIRTPSQTTDRGGMGPQQEEAIERNNQLNQGWKQMLKDPEYLQKMQEQRGQQQTAQRENEGPEHDDTGGRER